VVETLRERNNFAAKRAICGQLFASQVVDPRRMKRKKKTTIE